MKEKAGVPNKMRAGFKKLKNKEGLSIEERDELYKAYKGIVELMTYGNFYDNKKPNKRRKELSELTFDINYALVGSKRLGSYQGRFEKILKKFLNMINTQIKREEKGLKTDYRKAIRASKLDDVKNIFKNTTKYARTQKGIQKGTNEGFGSDESLTKTEKKKFEKARKENAEQLGYKLTGKSDVNESVNERMDKRQAGETLKQLGGNRFIAMTGAKNFVVGPKGMGFKIGRNAKNVNYVRIDLDRGKDLYDMYFNFVSVRGVKVKAKVKGVYADDLRGMFTKHTGMYTSL